MLRARLAAVAATALLLVAAMASGAEAASGNCPDAADVTVLRRVGEINAYIDLLFLAMIVLLCVSKIVTN